MKCYICLTDSIVTRKDYLDLLKVMLISARKNTSLHLVCLYDGNTNDLVYKLLKEFNVEIILHQLPYKQELMEIYPREWMLQNLGREIEYNRIFGTFMRMEIPVVEKEEKYVLYSDIDVIFNADILLEELPHPTYLAAAPEYERNVEDMEYFNAGGDFPERDYCMVVLFLNCGMRLSELVGMDLGDIDLEQRQIRLFGKGHKERMVYMNEACVEALQLYLAKRNTMEGLNPKEKAVFVTRRRKERISNRRVEQLVTGAMKAAGLKGFSTHKLRHTAATLMYQTGNVDILTLKQLLGHSSVGTTQIYTHLQEFQVRAAIEQNPLGTVTPEKARLDTTKRAAGENRGENNADSMDVEEAASPMEAFEGAANDGIRVDISSMPGDKETV